MAIGGALVLRIKPTSSLPVPQTFPEDRFELLIDVNF